MSKIVKNNAKNKKKDKYKIINWSSYNESLKQRGSLTIWIEEAALKNWYDQGPNQQGAQYYYSDECIECLMGLKCVYKLPYRQLEGFSTSILKLMGYDLEVPSYTQINRRAKELDVKFDLPKSRKLHLVFDSTGLKVYGEGEWKVRKHGYSKRRTWRKLHLGVDEKSGLIYAQSLTTNSIDDAIQLKPMLEQIEKQTKVKKVGADGAYDKDRCWTELDRLHIEGIIPPREDAVYWLDQGGELLDHQRNEILKLIDEIGRKEWKIQSGYHRRSLSETAMMRFKTIFGNQLFSRKLSHQQVEATIKVKVLNTMTGIGMPISKKVA